MRTFAVEDGDADWRAVDVVLSPSGSTFTVVAPDGFEPRGRLPAAGRLQRRERARGGRRRGRGRARRRRGGRRDRRGGGVPGRLERIDAGQPFLVVVDYAHKPDAVEAAIARPASADRRAGHRRAGRRRRPRPRQASADGRDRRPARRPARRHRRQPPQRGPGRDPRGVWSAPAGPGPWSRSATGARRSATRWREAAAGDVVLIAGKGHETGQEVGGVVHPFDDRDVVREELTGDPRR